MYLLYEHHKDPASGAILATDMLLSSVYPGIPAIHFFKPIEKALFEFCKMTFKESIHKTKRTYDPVSCVWSFFDNAGKQIYDNLKASPLASAGLQFIRVDALVEQALKKYISAPTISMFDPADFFYQQAAPPSNGLSREQLVKSLAAMMQLSPAEIESQPLTALKKPYRVAALRLHPDRNNGDGSKMSELNWLWQQWQPYAAPQKVEMQNV